MPKLIIQINYLIISHTDMLNSQMPQPKTDSKADRQIS